MRPKGPVGRCRYCGQEFMRRQSLDNHEANHCLQRPSVLAESAEDERPRWRQATRIGGGIGWVRDEDG